MGGRNWFLMNIFDDGCERQKANNQLTNMTQKATIKTQLRRVFPSQHQSSQNFIIVELHLDLISVIEDSSKVPKATLICEFSRAR